VEVGDYAVAIVTRGGERRVLSRGYRGSAGLAWTRDGDAIWFSANNHGADPALYAVNMSGKERVVQQIAGWFCLEDIGSTGGVLFGATNSRIGLRWKPPDQPEREYSWLDTSLVYDLTHDASRILFHELSHGEGRNAAIYLRKTDGSEAVRLGDGNRPSLSPDGRWVMCIRNEGATSHLRLLPTGAGDVRTLSGPPMRYEAAEWFPGGDRVLFTAAERGRPPRTYVQALDGRPPQQVTNEGVRASKVTPDGKSVLIVDGGKLFLRPVESDARRHIGNLEPSESPIAWSNGGASLFIRRTSPDAIKIFRLHLSGGRRELWREIKPPEPGATFIGPVAITPDGKSFAFSYQRDTANLFLVEGLG
jgi:dipeptidyl aminopeptidase/acylaminoacyl peptidase